MILRVLTRRAFLAGAVIGAATGIRGVRAARYDLVIK
jgi:hypothetical protein